jgi:pterin-4a-carbinolamine dehydratase
VLLVVVPDLQHVLRRDTDPTIAAFSKRVRLSVTTHAIHNVGRFDFELVVGL